MKKGKGLKRISDKKLEAFGHYPATSFYNQKKQGRISSKKVYYKDILFDSLWELEGYKDLELRQLAGEITDLVDHEIITFKVYNEAGEYLEFQINIDFSYFDKTVNRKVRHDRKSSKKLVKKVQEWWLRRWELLKFSQPDFMYVLEYQR